MLIGTSYNPSNIDAMLNKINSDIHLYQESPDENFNQGPGESISRFKKLIIQSCADTLTMNTVYSAKARHQEKMAGDWEKVRSKVVDSRGIDYFTVPSPKRPKNTNEIVPQALGEYHRIINKYFNAKVEKKNYNMINELVFLEQSRKELDRESLELVWKLIDSQISEFSDESPESLAENILNNTCGFYEKLFIERVIVSTKEEGLRKKIVAYAVNSTKRIPGYKAENDGNGQPMWAILFTFLRGGLKNELIEYCKNTPGCREVSRYFAEYFADGRVSEESLADILAILNSGEVIDLFKRAIFIVLSRHNQEIDELQENSLEDYLWFKLKIVWSCDEATAVHLEYTHQNYSILMLSELQKYIIDCGPEHFNNSAPLYTTALLSALCYGEAVSHLYGIYQYSTEALHLAILLRENSLLPTFSNSDTMFDDIDGITHMNFNKAISDYIKHFSIMLPNEALMYISFMSSDQCKITESSNLIIGYESYQIVLIPEIYIFSGSFRKAIGESNFKLTVETIAEYALSTHSKEAASLFDLVNNHQSVLRTWIIELKFEINKLASKWMEDHGKVQSISEERGYCEMLNYPAKHYAKLYDKYKQQRVFEKYSDLESSLAVLNCFFTFYTALAMRQFRHALSILGSTQLFPMRPLTRYVELVMRIKPLSVEVREELPRVLLNCLEVHQLLISKVPSYEAHELIADIRNLIEYYGELQHSLKGFESVEDKFKMYSTNIREILSSIIIN